MANEGKDFAAPSDFPRVVSGLRAPKDGTNRVFNKDRKLTVDQLRKIEDDQNKELHLPRPYQLQLFEEAKACNVIAVMDTGSGKTLIAILLVRHILSLEHDRRAQGGSKRICFFLVPTVPLVFQQRDYLKHHLCGEVQALCGELLGDAWTADQWQKTLREKDVVCATPAIVLDALNHAFLKMEDIALMIFDEAHHATKDHPYALIMREHYHEHNETERPKILALTASPLNSDSAARMSLWDLEFVMDANAVTVFNDEVVRYAARPDPISVYYPSPTDEYMMNLPPLCDALQQMAGDLPSLEKPLREARYVHGQLGPWCATQSLWSALEALQRQSEKDLAGALKISMDAALSGTGIDATDRYTKLLADCRHVFPDTDPTEAELSPKVRKLIEVLNMWRNDPSFCGIIFVQRRATAELLSQLLSRLDCMQRFLHIGTLIGHAINDPYRNQMKMTEQYQTIRDFRRGKLNLLVATKVAEESLDIQACNMVIRFDMEKESMNLVNYIQSRGRARKPNSKFILLMEQDNMAHQNHLESLKQKERQIREVLQDRSLKKEQAEIFDNMWSAAEKAAPTYSYHVKETGAVVTLASAKSMLAYFCDLQVIDEFTKGRAEYTLKPTATIPASEESTKANEQTQPTAAKKNNVDDTQLLSDKQVADVVEAILGASCHEDPTLRGALRALRNIYSSEFYEDFKDYVDGVQKPSRPSSMRDGGKKTVEEMEKCFGYCFKDPYLLLEAFTHPSSTDRSINSYQRLEFLGDAVLGYLAVRHFFYKYPELPPGRLVDLKDAAVNNAFLACVASNLGLHHYIHHFSSPLIDAITDYCEDLYRITNERQGTDLLSPPQFPTPEEVRSKPPQEQKAIEEEKKRDIQYWNDLEPPKTISDVFEAVLGAIFLDSHLSVETVWKAMQRTWLPWVDAYITPALVARHPYREMADVLRREGCDAWRVPTKHDAETGEFVARFVVHQVEVLVERGPSRKMARKVLAERALEMFKGRPGFVRERCTCAGIVTEEGVVRDEALEEELGGDILRAVTSEPPRSLVPAAVSAATA
ncbi:Dicer-like protein 1 [Rhizophlyctis rosea]|nr:Dicer-like protein 1 [Rhizophlyctis rosea]